MKSATNFNKNDSRTDTEHRFDLMYATIRERICLLEYAPGERLSEAVLAREFDVSRTPVRSVSSKLESEGLVITRHGAGNFVTDIELDYLCDSIGYLRRSHIKMALQRLIEMSPEGCGK